MTGAARCGPPANFVRLVRLTGRRLDMYRSLAAALVLFLSCAQLVAQPRPRGEQDRVIYIPLDTTGVADWSFLNPASVRSIEGSSVIFENTTLDRTFVVTLPLAAATDHSQ